MTEAQASHPDTPQTPPVGDVATGAGAPTGPGTGRSYTQIVWRQFRKNLPAMVGLALVLVLFLAAVLAPFIANKYPYYWHTSEDGLMFPLLQSLTNMDLALLLAAALVLLVPVTRRVLNSTGWRFWEHNDLRRAIVISLLVWGVATALIFGLRVVPEHITTEVESVVDGQRVVTIQARDFRSEARRRDDVECLFPPVPYAPGEVPPVIEKFKPPSKEHPMGTDSVGRSVAARMVYATRTSLAVGFISVGISLLIGVIVGGISAYFGGWVDLALQRLVEIFICFPTFFLMLFIIAMFGAKLWLIMVAIGLVGWSGIARLIRAEILKVRTLDYITAAEALGLPSMRIILRHAVPNAIAPVLVTATFRIAGAVAFEAALSFLNLGDPNHPSWGYLLSQARRVATEHPSLLIIPGVAIFLAVLGYNLVGEGLRDAIDPRLKV